VGSPCLGTDLNRNGDYQWGVVGDSADPCNDVYRGPSAGSEKETQALSSLLLGLGGTRCVLFTDVHSFFSSWTSVWGYTTNLPTNYDSYLLKLMQRAQSAIRLVNGLSFAIGTDARVISPASGGSKSCVCRIFFPRAVSHLLP
jgi:hypothetical protein